MKRTEVAAYREAVEQILRPDQTLAKTVRYDDDWVVFDVRPPEYYDSVMAVDRHTGEADWVALQVIGAALDRMKRYR